jgi:putative transposase
MEIKNELLDELLKGYKNPEDLLGKDGIVNQLTKRLLERAMHGEITHHLGYEKNCSAAETNNRRNGTTPKTVKTSSTELTIEVPRDRASTFEPQLIKKHQRRFEGFDAAIISMYARGMCERDIREHLKELYSIEVSAELVSTVIESVLDDVRVWQNRPLAAVYPIVYLDAVMVKVKDNGHIMPKAIYLAMGVGMDGSKEVLGMWIAQTEGAKFWLMILNEIKNRGVQDIFIACVDGLKGFEEAITSIFPQTQVQLCLVHMVRNSLKYVSWKDRKAVAAALKQIYAAATEEGARQALNEFRTAWETKYPTIGPLWERHWQGIIPFLAYPEFIRKAIYTTNAIESLNHSLRKITKSRGAFPNDEAVLRLLFLGLQNASKKWTMPIRNWKGALNQFAIMFEDRFPANWL